jgi:hypothetical protein
MHAAYFSTEANADIAGCADETLSRHAAVRTTCFWNSTL